MLKHCLLWYRLEDLARTIHNRIIARLEAIGKGIGEPPNGFDRVVFIICIFGLASYIGWLALILIKRSGG